MSPFFSTIRSHRAFKALHYREFRLICGGQLFGNIGTISQPGLPGSQQQ